MALNILPQFYERTHKFNRDRKTIENAIKALRKDEQDFHPRYNDQNLGAPPPYSEVNNSDRRLKEAGLHKARDHIRWQTRKLQSEINMQKAFVEILVTHVSARQAKLAVVNELDVAVIDLIAELESDLPPIQLFLDTLPTKYKVEGGEASDVESDTRMWHEYQIIRHQLKESNRRCRRIEEAISRGIAPEEILYTSFEDWIIETQKPAPEVIRDRFYTTEDILMATGLTAPTMEDLAAALAALEGLRGKDISGWGNPYSADAVDRIKTHVVEVGNANLLRAHLNKLWTQRGRFHLTDAYNEDFESRIARLKCIQIRIAELTAGDGRDAEKARQDHAQSGSSVYTYVMSAAWRSRSDLATERAS